MELRPYQLAGRNFLASSSAALLADEMGLGKTVQVAAAIGQLRAGRSFRRGLIVAPASLLTNWLQELARWGPRLAIRTTSGLSRRERRVVWDLPIPITITSYETLREDFLPVAPVVDLDLVVFDEAQRVKNPAAEVTIAARRVDASRRWALSGTPLENSVGDLASLAEVLGLISVTGKEASLPDVLEALQGRFLRRRKLDVLPELPPILDQELPLDITTDQRREYEAELAGSEYDQASRADILALITRLKQICNFATTGASAKRDTLLDILNDPGMSDAHVIVVSQYTETLKWLAPQLPCATQLFVGSMSQAARESALTAFAESQEASALLLSLKAGGVGLNIPHATHVVLFDRWWNPAAEEQAINRAHRFGRELPLTVYRFRTVGTIEDQIVRIIGERRQLFDDVVNEQLAGDEASERWTREELLRLLHETTLQ